MGLPQVPSNNMAVEEVATSLYTLVHAPARYGSLGSCDMSGIDQLGTHGPRDFPCISARELFNGSGIHNFQGDGPANVDRLKMYSQGRDVVVAQKGGRDIQPPVSRIVGFEANGANSSEVFGERKDGAPSTNLAIPDGALENKGFLARKRLLSPSNGMLVRDNFSVERLDIGHSTLHSSLALSSRTSDASNQECKKDNVGNASYSMGLSSGGVSPPDESFMADCTIITDGPVVEKEFQSVMRLPTPADQNYPAELECDCDLEDHIDSYLTLEDIKQSLAGTISGPLSSKKEHNRSANRSFQGIEGLSTNFEQFTPKSPTDLGGCWVQNLAITSQCPKFSRSLSGQSVRRSLIGSFEESLLSGHLASGVNSQRIEGFLAVLNIAGGSFSPHPQKLPFTVTSFDGDNCLFYYSSIDLPDQKLSSRFKGPKLKRSLSIDSSDAGKGSLRIPMKGCIQLVMSLTTPDSSVLHSFLCVSRILILLRLI
ncbi:hypothetical protein LIER_42935 [Lithospermum erythrorhizon]|uniref:Atos-like conserved domain-containing protein n=1 Tax=Lithospermum erythrorhizon TaxID=34254 RepID=A0AAV3P8L7_LITER